MYFVNIRKKFSSSTFLLHLLPAGTVLIAVLGLTLLGWRNAQQAYDTERSSTIDRIVTETSTTVQEKLASYELMLLGTKGLFNTKGAVQRSEWQSFVAIYNTSKNYPGVQGVGYAVNVKSGGIATLEKQVQSEGYKNFSVYPKSTNNERVVLLYYEPSSLDSLGFDLFSEEKRRQAIEASKATGESTITGKLDFVRSKDQLGTSGFSMYMPVYINSKQHTLPINERSVQGYVFTPIDANIFFNKALTSKDPNSFGLRIYDSSAKDENLLYESSNFAMLNNDRSFSHNTSIELFGRTWVMDFRFSPDSIASTTRTRPISSLILGIMLSLLLSGFVLTLLIARTRVLAHAKQMEVQSAKDELLSLASHQLRTPATSVKQYLGMALEGFAGKLSLQQKNLLEKAYESNERQLNIINEILYVAKIDAKGIVLTPRRINLNKLLRDLTQEMSTTAKKQQQKIRLHLPMKQTYIEADEYCLRMALENLISNALKYSHEGTTTNVKLQSGKDSVRIIVKDRGVGIDQDDLSLLFQRFSRIPNELSRQTSGSGIGLYLSQQLILLHGGTIEVNSVKGKGTTFEVELPKKYTPGETDTDAV